jgi:hypothetical protein
VQRLGAVFAHSPNRIRLPRKGCRVGLHIVLFEVCSTFTRVAACTLARSPIRDPLTEGFSHFVTSMAAPVASGSSDCRVGLTPTGKRRLSRRTPKPVIATHQQIVPAHHRAIDHSLPFAPCGTHPACGHICYRYRTRKGLNHGCVSVGG